MTGTAEGSAIDTLFGPVRTIGPYVLCSSRYTEGACPCHSLYTRYKAVYEAHLGPGIDERSDRYAILTQVIVQYKIKAPKSAAVYFHDMVAAASTNAVLFMNISVVMVESLN